MNIAERLWGRTVSTAIHQLDRSKFANDEEYLLAAAKLDMTNQSKEFRDAYRRVSNEFKRQQEEQRRKQEEAEFERLMKTVKLDAEGQRRVDERASEAASRDLAAKRIFAKDLTKKSNEYRAQFEQEELRSKVAGIVMNNAFRQSFSRVEDD